MKKLSVLLIAAALLVATMSAAFAATMYVDTANHKTLNLRSHENDKVIASINVVEVVDEYDIKADLF